MIALGIAGRLIVAFKTYGFRYDMDSLVAVRNALREHPLHLYSIVNGHPYNRWPYPPGFLPWVVAASGLKSVTGLAYHGFVQVAQILSDAAIAWLVQDHLGRRGTSARLRLVAAGAVALGPSFFLISGYHGQIDSAAILPVVFALWLWDRLEPGVRRALVTGVLIGIAASIKTVPVLMIFAFLPSVRSRREGAALVVPAVAVPLLALAPFLAVDHHAVVEALRSHRALPGFGGLSIVAQPSLVRMWFNHDPIKTTALTDFLTGHEFVLVAVLLAPFVAVVLMRRIPPTGAAMILWSALLLLSIGFAFQYVVWALPFALMAGYVPEVVLLQVALAFPTVMWEFNPIKPPPHHIYYAIMFLVWAVALIALLRVTWRLARAGPPGTAAGAFGPRRSTAGSGIR
jgi:hypothetical protein